MSFVILILLVNCKKDNNGKNPNTPKNIVRCDEAMVAYFGSYGKGSWWVFKEAKYNQIDTVKVIYFAQSWWTDINPPPENYEIGFMGKFIEHTIMDIDLIQNNMTEVHLINYSGNGGPRVYLKDGQFIAENRFGGDTAIYYPSYKVGDTVFSDVLLITDSAPYDSFFFAKNIGLIKKTQGDHNYLLEAFNIIKPK